MKYFSLLLLSILMDGCHSGAQFPVEDDAVPKLDSLMQQIVTNYEFSGTVLVGNREKVLYKKAWGKANRDWDIPMSTENQFDIASLNKSFIAALVLLAEKDGKWKLQDPVKKYFKQGVVKELYSEKITFHHLLTHTSGLADYDGLSDDLKLDHYRKFKRMNFTNTAYINYIGELKKRSEAGEEFYYSNFGYHLLALLLEDVYGESFNEILQRKICQPLNLKATVSYESNTEVKKGLVTAYTYNAKRDVWNSNQFIDISLGRRIFSTAGDLYNWAKALDHSDLIDEDMKQKMQRNHLEHLDSMLSYGYGLVIHDKVREYDMGNIHLKKPYFIHGGSTEGYKSIMINVSGSELILIMLTNSGDQIDELWLADNIIQTINP